MPFLTQWGGKVFVYPTHVAKDKFLRFFGALPNVEVFEFSLEQIMEVGVDRGVLHSIRVRNVHSLDNGVSSGAFFTSEASIDQKKTPKNASFVVASRRPLDCSANSIVVRLFIVN
jgi:hypothetical protein